jgi:hypothetical protein
VLVLTCATNLLILAIPIYLFQISDRVLTSRSVDTLVMLTSRHCRRGDLARGLRRNAPLHADAHRGRGRGAGWARRC